MDTRIDEHFCLETIADIVHLQGDPATWSLTPAWTSALRTEVPSRKNVQLATRGLLTQGWLPLRLSQWSDVLIDIALYYPEHLDTVLKHLPPEWRTRHLWGTNQVRQQDDHDSFFEDFDPRPEVTSVTGESSTNDSPTDEPNAEDWARVLRVFLCQDRTFESLALSYWSFGPELAPVLTEQLHHCSIVSLAIERIRFHEDEDRRRFLEALATHPTLESLTILGGSLLCDVELPRIRQLRISGVRFEVAKTWVSACTGLVEASFAAMEPDAGRLLQECRAATLEHTDVGMSASLLAQFPRLAGASVDALTTTPTQASTLQERGCRFFMDLGLRTPDIATQAHRTAIHAVKDVEVNLHYRGALDYLRAIDAPEGAVLSGFAARRGEGLAALQLLARSGTLDTLVIRANRPEGMTFSEEDIDVLAACSCLRRLSLTGIVIDAALADGLKRLPLLEQAALSGPVDEEGAIALAAVMPGCRRLRELKLHFDTESQAPIDRFISTCLTGPSLESFEFESKIDGRHESLGAAFVGFLSRNGSVVRANIDRFTRLRQRDPQRASYQRSMESALLVNVNLRNQAILRTLRNAFVSALQKSAFAPEGIDIGDPARVIFDQFVDHLGPGSGFGSAPALREALKLRLLADPNQPQAPDPS